MKSEIKTGFSRYKTIRRLVHPLDCEFHPIDRSLLDDSSTGRVRPTYSRNDGEPTKFGEGKMVWRTCLKGGL